MKQTLLKTDVDSLDADVFKHQERNSAFESKTGRVTVPGQENMSDQVAEIARKWGADAIRDSDGTKLDNSFLDMGYRVYSTICLVRADQEWAKKNPGYLAGKYFMSVPLTARSRKLEIQLMSGYFGRKYKVNFDDEPKDWWEVIDRTASEIVDPRHWNYDVACGGVVTIENAEPFHVYTVNFLVHQTWDSTSMYNHMTNNWDRPPVQSVDPYLPECREHLYSFFDRWLDSHPDSDVVRLTSLAYHFVLDTDQNGREKYRDWIAYIDCVNTKALRDFEADKGYKLRPEHLVDQGYYNSINRVPTKEYLDWMDFIQKFVVDYGKELVSKIHQKGKKAALFWGDHWIGAEFYHPDFQKMGFDINIGACDSGTALRRLSDAPGPQEKEIRLYPYLFPDVFSPGNDPVYESQSCWINIRRALLRRQIDRIGYGGYVSLALEYPDFVEHVAQLCDEFRTILDKISGTGPYTHPVTVGILDCWGSLRSWIHHAGPEEKFKSVRPDTFQVIGSNLLECICGLPVEVRFISLDDVISGGVPGDVDVLINDGFAGTSWSGGDFWENPSLVSKIRAWVENGGGFIGVSEPSAHEFGGKFFQLSDVIGVEKETGSTTGYLTLPYDVASDHFITRTIGENLDMGVDKSYVYPIDSDVKVLSASDDGHIRMSVNHYGRGRAVYLSSLPYNNINSRLLLRALMWASNQEHRINDWLSSNPQVECAYFPETKNVAVANTSFTHQKTIISNDNNSAAEFALDPCRIEWFEADEIDWRKF
jgi:1,3-beta-galactosyl-N-acetylhexosamine phosphorylase